MSVYIGDIGEAKFITKCLEYGHTPCKPFSHNVKYDVLLETENRIYRVQVKTCSKLSSRGRYEFNICSGRGGKHSYSIYDVDLLALYIIPTDDFYIVGQNIFSNKTRLNIYPNNEKYIYYLNRFNDL